MSDESVIRFHCSNLNCFLMHSLSAAVFYVPDGYDTGGKRLLGRQAAGEGFLKAVLRHSRCDRLFCYAYDRAAFEDFQQRVQAWGLDPDGIDWLVAGDPRSANQADVLYHPSPGLGDLAWRRRMSHQRGYGLCGVTHTTASRAAMESIGQLTIAPVQPWDALICTSQAVRTGVERVIDHWSEYLAQQFGRRPEIALDLPVIPLGVDCDRFVAGSGETDRDRRQGWRQQLEIADDDIVILFVGRLIAYAKAHPIPMYEAIERAARCIGDTGRRIHLIQAGWFESERDEAMFKETMPTLCPSVNGIFLDGRDRHVRDSIWSAADIFISLADNIQETFGLTPIEAMAAGLPVVVSDWNGYKESVRHGIDGFRVPTVTPPPGSGVNLAWDYYEDRINYSTYVGESANAVAIDIDSCAASLVELIENPDLRRQLGANGQQRARSVYDWRQVIASYDDLWEQMRDRRSSELERAPQSPNHPAIPMIEDPFSAFAHYPSQILQDHDTIALGVNAAPDRFQALRNVWANRIGDRHRLTDADLERVFDLLKTRDHRVSELIAAIVQRHAPVGTSQDCSDPVGSAPSELSAAPTAAAIGEAPQTLHRRVYLTLTYLLKFDIVQLRPHPCD
jgi:glycosyltransferase involved in cell wall biosynthesis